MYPYSTYFYKLLIWKINIYRRENLMKEQLQEVSYPKLVLAHRSFQLPEKLGCKALICSSSGLWHHTMVHSWKKFIKIWKHTLMMFIYVKTDACSQTHTKYILSILPNYLPRVYIYVCLTAIFSLFEYFIKIPQKKIISF